ncbi:uncharacterized protein LOC125370028 [Ricinus communis]|uniref:uncharacterized protein LOC125370028 n=1 Tax=Ricinus communis TaxID=3988 RepID=UPI00201AD4EC|nr:uncharacterized protein LOC125370028 [Ricinus communis]
MLKKDPHPWGTEQTTAVQRLKELAHNPPPFTIPSTGNLILQTDASDHAWGAILLENLNNKEQLCGYASGQFSPSEKHYHSTYKEILVVKYGIKKFEFFLIGQRFLVRMDNSSFSKILESNQKTLPEPQLLRLKSWFSIYDFEVQHIKGTRNLIPDFLSRLSKPQPKHQPIVLLTSTVNLPIIFMASSSSKNPLQPPSPPDLPTNLTTRQVNDFAKNMLFHYLATIQQTFLPPI